VAFNGRFSPEIAFEILDQNKITHSFLFPTALKAMMKADAHPRKHYKIQLQGLMSAGEAVGDAVFAYCRDELGVVVNEMFGQTEINYVVGNCHIFWPPKPGSMGRGYPGHLVAVIDEQGHVCQAGVPGEVAVRRNDRHGHRLQPEWDRQRQERVSRIPAVVGRQHAVLGGTRHQQQREHAVVVCGVRHRHGCRERVFLE
jgi:acetyl-CoA synthetase